MGIVTALRGLLTMLSTSWPTQNELDDIFVDFFCLFQIASFGLLVFCVYILVSIFVAFFVGCAYADLLFSVSWFSKKEKGNGGEDLEGVGGGRGLIGI